MAFDELKERQSVVWGSGPYGRISAHVATAHDHLLRAVEPRPGQRWLDVAASTGEIARSDDRPVTSIAAKETTAKRLQVDFLFLDLTTCTRCRGTDESLESALEVARESLAATGTTEVEVNKIHVASAGQARALRFESSPTIRINGRDVALELRESSCGSEACTDGCGESIACRVWVHGGQEYTEPPLAMILDAMLREIYAGAVVEHEARAEPYELPENLERFFAGKVATEVTDAAGEVSDEAPLQVGCCPPAEQRSCCDPEDKAECCDASSGEGCGCR